MSKKSSTVILRAGDTEKEHEISHAEALLRMPENGGWYLPKDSPYEMTEKDGLKIRAGKKAYTEAE